MRTLGLKVGAEVGLKSFFCQRCLLFWTRAFGCIFVKWSGQKSRRKPVQVEPGEWRRRLCLQAKGLGNLGYLDPNAAGIMGVSSSWKPLTLIGN